MATKNVLRWDAQNTPVELHPILRALAEDYRLVEGVRGGGVKLAFDKGAEPGAVTVAMGKGLARITYDKPHHALRGLGTVLAGVVELGQTVREQTPFETFGIMLDCSRNAVMTVGHFKLWLRQLALLGYNMAMLYTEDTYQLAGEDYFGYLRGRYTADELRELDGYAAALGMELIGCVQALGHLEQVLKWNPYAKVRDTSSVLMVDEPATYELIDKMVANFAACYRSRRIHVGMDETHDLGRGRFMDLHGQANGYDLYNRHLERVAEICRTHGLRPMIWSDMFFRLGSKTQDYYGADCHIPAEVGARIPREAQLVYWDYYHDTEAFYAEWIKRHRAAGFEPVMAGGVWTWGQTWYARGITEKNTAPCVKACRAAGLKELFFTLWGDDGGYCEFDSALAGLAYGAELAYAGDELDAAKLQRRFAAVCGSDYAAAVEGSAMEAFGAAHTLWDDPLLGICRKARAKGDPEYWSKASAHYAALIEKLAPHAKTAEPLDFNHLVTLAACLKAKVDFGMALEQAYAGRDPAAIKAVIARVGPVVKTIDKLLATFRRQWLANNKPFGLETMQIRLGALKQRYLETKQRLGELAAGKIQSIPELDELPGGTAAGWTWRNFASGSSIL